MFWGAEYRFLICPSVTSLHRNISFSFLIQYMLVLSSSTPHPVEVLFLLTSFPLSSGLDGKSILAEESDYGSCVLFCFCPSSVFESHFSHFTPANCFSVLSLLFLFAQCYAIPLSLLFLLIAAQRCPWNG